MLRILNADAARGMYSEEENELTRVTKIGAERRKNRIKFDSDWVVRRDVRFFPGIVECESSYICDGIGDSDGDVEKLDMHVW